MNVERFLGIAAVVFALPVGVASWGYGVGTPQSPGAGFWPLAIAVVMFGLGLILFFQADSDEMPLETASSESRWGKFWLSLGTLVFYVAFLESLGYLLTTALVLLAQLRFVEDRSWRSSLFTAIFAAVISLLVFRVLLKVSLPQGVIPLPAGW